LNIFWHTRGQFSEGCQRLGRLLGLPGHVDPKTRVRALNAAGHMATGQLDLALARSLYEESLAIGRDLGDTACVVSALNALAFVARHVGDPARARALLEECLELSQQAADERAVARSLINLGQQILKFDHDPEAAHALYENALAIAERLNDVAAVAMCLSHLGDVAKARGDVSTAMPCTSAPSRRLAIWATGGPSR
jgi:tetratricopeptide (TPR) repeat protein